MKRRQKELLLAILAIIVIAAGTGWYEQKHTALQISQTYQLRYGNGEVCGLDLNGMNVTAFVIPLDGGESQVLPLSLLDGEPNVMLGEFRISRTDGRWDFADPDPNEAAKDLQRFAKINMTDVRYASGDQTYYGIEMLEDGRQVPAVFKTGKQTIRQVVYPVSWRIQRARSHALKGLAVLAIYLILIELFCRRKSGFPVWGLMVLVTAPVFMLGYAGLNDTVRTQVEQELQSDRTQLLLNRVLTQVQSGDSDDLSDLNQENLRLYDPEGEELLNLPEEIAQAVRRTAENSNIISLSYSSGGECLDSLMLHVTDNEDETIGVLEAFGDVREHMLEAAERIQVIQRSIFLISLALLVVVLLIVIFNMRLLATIRRALEAAGQGYLDVRVSVHGRSEAAALGRSFNQALSGIDSYISDLELFHRKYSAFVPQAEIQAMGRKDVGDIRPGDECEIRAAVLTLKKKTPENKRHELVREIRELGACGGIIHRFEENGLECLYPDEPGRALDGVVNFLQKECGRESHFGISFGLVRLGVMGEERRAEIVMVSQEEGLSRFLTEMAEEYGASLLVTDWFFQEAESAIATYHYRCLGYVYLSLAGRLLKVYEILDGEPWESRQKKLLTREDFEAGVEAFMSGDYERGRRLFVRVLREHRDDQAARHYIYLCDGYLREGMPGEIHPCLDTY